MVRKSKQTAAVAAAKQNEMKIQSLTEKQRVKLVALQLLVEYVRRFDSLRDHLKSWWIIRLLSILFVSFHATKDIICTLIEFSYSLTDIQKSCRHGRTYIVQDIQYRHETTKYCE